MFDGGHRLKLARLKRCLTYRDIEHLSRILSERYSDDRFTVRISVLADIENHRLVPTIFRLYTLCLIYELDMPTVIEWYGFRPKAGDRKVVKQYIRWVA
jgi:hypothetical protein